MAAKPAEPRKVDLKGENVTSVDSSLLMSFKSTKGKQTTNQQMSSNQSQSLSFEIDTFNGYLADKESETEELHPQGLPVKRAAEIAKYFADNLVKTTQTETDKVSKRWSQEAAMTTGDSDVESVDSDDSGLGVVEEVQTLDDQATEFSDDDFFDLSFETDLQAKREQFLDRMKAIQVIFEKAPISHHATSNQNIYSEIQVHALEIAAIFGDDIEKLRKEVLNLNSKNQLQGEQLKKAQHSYGQLKIHMGGVTRLYVKHVRRLHEIISKKCAVENELQATKVENDQMAKSSQWLSEEHRKVISCLHTASEELKANHQFELTQLKNQNEVQREQLEHRFYKDRVLANGLLFSESEKVRKLEAELDAVEKDSARRIDDLKSELLYLRGCCRITEKQHKQDTELLKDSAEKAFEEMRLQKDAQIRLLDEAMQDLTRLSTVERVDFTEKIKERDCWMRNQTFACKDQIQKLESDLRESRILHSNYQQRLYNLHDLESKIEVVYKENSVLKNTLQEAHTSLEALDFNNQLNQREQAYFHEQMNKLKAENTKLAEMFHHQEEEACANADIEVSLAQLVAELKLKSDRLEATCKDTVGDVDEVCDVDHRIKEMRASMAERRLARLNGQSVDE